MIIRYRNQDLGLLLLRWGLAYIFIEHGLQKLTHVQATLKFFSHLGLPGPFLML